MGYDFKATIAARPGLNDPKYPMWIPLVTNALWTGSEDAQAGYSDEEKCAWCGANESGVEHMIMRCATLAKARADKGEVESLSEAQNKF